MNMALLATMSHSTETMLITVGWGMILCCAALIVVPYLRRRSELITAWNCVLFGCAINLGVGCLEAVDRTKSFFERYLSYEFPDADYRDVLLRNTVYFVMMLVMYYGLKLFRKFSRKRFQVNPEWSGLLLAYVLIICAVLILCVSFVTFPFFKEVIFNLAQKAAIFAGVFSFYAWYKNRGSIGMLLIAIVVLGLAALFCIQISPGRRLLLTLFAAPPFVAYWLRWRYSNPAKVLVLSSLAVTIIVMGGLSYGLIRRFDTHGGRLGRTERTFSNIVERLGDINMEGIKAQLTGWKHLLAQSNYEYSLLTKRVIDHDVVEVHPLNTLQFITCYPVPRRMWHNKPTTIALDLPRRHLGLPQDAVWGVGPAGHSYYEGGYLALIVYAGVLILIVRLIDEPLLREPNNPFFIATMTASFAYLVNTIRGDMGTQFAELLECFLFALLLNWSSRLICSKRKMAYGGSSNPLAKFPAQKPILNGPNNTN